MKILKLILTTLLLVVVYVAAAQCNGRYENELFAEVEMQTVTYTDVYNWSISELGLEMDVYQPIGDTLSNRPLIIFAHGGAYIGGDKNSLTMTTLCQSFAKRGYVTASIRYRLTSPTSFFLPNAEEILIQTMVNSMSDMKASIRYFRKDVYENGNTYNVNPNLIFVGGYSAGAITALHVSSVDSQEVPMELMSYFENAGGIEGNSGNDGYSSEVSGAVVLAGAIKELSFFDENDVPVVSIHGTNDDVVSYNCDNVYQNSNLPSLCGSGEVHPKLNTLGIYNDLFTINNGGHEAPMFNLNQTYIPFISDFLFELVCNDVSKVTSIKPNSMVLWPNPTSGQTMLDLPDGMNELSLYNQLGHLVLNENTNRQSFNLNIAHLPSAVYYLVCFNKLSSRQFQAKLIKY